MTIVMNAPDKIGKYRITGVIGEGVSGVVYKAFDPSLQRVVAVKSLHLNLPVDARAAREFAGRLGEQAQTIARVNHPGIVSVHQIDEADGRAFIAMEHVAGLNLAQWLSVTPLPPQAALLQVMDQLLDALECAHHAGVRHGDLKLTNVIITNAGLVKVTDFGLARAEGRTGAMAGVAPEYQSDRLVDQRVDIYAAGAILYRMLVGRDPYSNALADTVADALTGNLRLPSTIAEAQRPPVFDAVVSRALKLDPGQRFTSAAEFRDALRDATQVRVPEHGTRAVTIDSGTAASNSATISPMLGESAPRAASVDSFARRRHAPRAPARPPAACRLSRSRFPTACCPCRRTTRGRTASRPSPAPATAPTARSRPTWSPTTKATPPRCRTRSNAIVAPRWSPQRRPPPRR